MAKFGNRVKETTDTTGTGTLDLNGAATGFRAFLDELTSGDQVYYLIVDDPANPTAYEYGVGTVTAGTPDTLSRDTVEGSSNAGNKVSFLAGTKTVIATETAAALGGAGPLSTWALKTAAVAAKTADATIVAADDGKLISGDASGLSPATLALTLPALAAADAGFVVAAINVGASGTVTLASGDSPAATINGAASLTLSGQYDAATLWWTGSAWLAIDTTLTLIDDDTFATASATTAPSSESTKAYVDAHGLVQRVYAEDGAVATGPTAIPLDDTIPQSDEGDEYMSLAITPTSATNRLRVRVRLNVSNSVNAVRTLALFKDADTDALAATSIAAGAANVSDVGVLEYEMVAGGTSEITFKVRAGAASGTTTVNGTSGARLFGGKMLSTIVIEEIKP